MWLWLVGRLLSADKRDDTVWVVANKFDVLEREREAGLVAVGVGVGGDAGTDVGFADNSGIGTAAAGTEDAVANEVCIACAAAVNCLVPNKDADVAAAAWGWSNTAEAIGVLVVDCPNGMPAGGATTVPQVRTSGAADGEEVE